MPVKGNQFKSNSFKDDNQPRQTNGKAEKEKIRQTRVA
jgi:S-DNA-T family DNA segregation ATPase FtsK/SpoIIIE